MPTHQFHFSDIKIKGAICITGSVLKLIWYQRKIVV
jgi:hypothetical protein